MNLSWLVLGLVGLTWLPPAPGAAVGPPGITIVDRPIAFDDERKQLTIEYRRAHQDPDIDDLTIAPTMVILHYTGGSSAQGTMRYFDHTRMEAARAKLESAGQVNVSAHFLVDRDGTIYRLMPETWMARHCIGLNHIAIGVENVGNDGDAPLTEAQVQADAALIRYLASRHPISHLIGHYESRTFEGTDLFVERDPAYRNSKPDPGEPFMAKVRALVADLGLQGAHTASSAR